MELNQDWRYERKFVIRKTDAIDLNTLIKCHAFGFQEAYPMRTVHNIYFDTVLLKYAEESREGDPYRKKVRIRWYNDDTSKCVLEIKEKRGIVGTKHHFTLAGDYTEHDKQAIQELLKKENLPPAIKELMHALEPTLINQYTREYYLSHNKKYRVTLDTNIQYKKPGGHKWKTDTNTIIEIKYNKEDANAERLIAQHFPFRLGKNSKYLNGLLRTHV